MSQPASVPGRWVSLVLEEAVDIHDNLREPVNSKERAPRQGEYPYYGATGRVDWIDDYKCDGEYVLLGEDGAPFLDPSRPTAYLVRGKFWVNNHAHILKGKNGLFENRFLLHLLNSLNYRHYVSGTTRLKLTQGSMRKLPLVLPSIQEQLRIVAKLDELFSELDAGVAALERTQATLKRYRASVLKAAVEGKLTEEWRQENPPDETGEELLERILVERRKHWEEEQLAKFKAQGRKPPKNWQKKYKEPLGPDKTDLPALPEGWIWSSIDQLIREPLRNGHSAKVVKSEDGVPIFSLSAVTEGDFSGRNIKTTSADPKKVRDLWVEINDIFIQRSNTPELVGTTRRYKEEIRRAIFPDLLIRIRILPPVLPDYVEYSLQSIRCHTYFRRNSQGSSGSMPKINQEVVRRAAIPIPPRLEQNTIVKVIEDQLSVVEYIATDIDIKLKGAQGLRQAILRHAFSGKLVPQHPKDEPASLLLERIRLAREVERPQKSRRSKISSQPTENA